LPALNTKDIIDRVYNAFPRELLISRFLWYSDEKSFKGSTFEVNQRRATHSKRLAREEMLEPFFFSVLRKCVYQAFVHKTAAKVD
jgi:hypothetical protein